MKALVVILSVGIGLVAVWAVFIDAYWIYALPMLSVFLGAVLIRYSERERA